MLKKIMSLALINILTFSMSSANAKLSDTYNKCMDNSGGVTVNMQDCMNTEHDYQDKLLNQGYKLIMKNLSDNAKKDFKKAQRAWLKWREAETSFAYSLLEGGTLASISADATFLQMTSDRVDYFNDYITRNELNNGNDETINGSYILKDEYRSGGLEISDVKNTDKKVVSISNVTNENGATCDYSGICTVTDSYRLECADLENSAKANLFIDILNGIAMVESDEAMTYCGMGGYLQGTYIKE